MVLYLNKDTQKNTGAWAQLQVTLIHSVLGGLGGVEWWGWFFKALQMMTKCGQGWESPIRLYETISLKFFHVTKVRFFEIENTQNFGPWSPQRIRSYTNGMLVIFTVNSFLVGWRYG